MLKYLVAFLLLGAPSFAQQAWNYSPAAGSGGGGGTGCVPAGGNAASNVVLYGTAGACSPDQLANFVNGALTLGASGSLGSLALGNATSGTLTLQPAAGVISGTALIPSGGGTLAFAATTLAGYGITNGATNGANSNITSLTGLTTPLSVAQGGSGAATLTSAGIVLAHGTSAFTALAEVDGDCVVGAAGAWTAASCGGGAGSSWNLTDGTTSLTAVTALTVPGGTLKVGGTAGAATLTPIVTDTSHTVSATTANIGGQDDYNGSSITATLATLAAGQTLVVTDQNATALTLALGGQTVNGLPLATTLHTGGFYGFSFNTTTSQLSGFGFPGFGTITSGALMKFADASGAATAGDLSGDCTTSGSLVVTCAKGSASTFGIVKVDGVTVTASGGVISAVGGAATTITPGTTTIAGATAPCTIRNTATTVMGCTAETGTGSVVLSASPALTGTPTAPTATVGTNTTQLATTAFVIANAGGGSGAVTLVSTQTASNSASLAWTGLTGNRYELRCSGIIWASSGNLTGVQFGEGGTPTWKTSGYNSSAYITTPPATITSGSGTNQPAIGYLGGIAITGTLGESFVVSLSDLASTTINKNFNLNGTWVDQSAIYHGMTFNGFYVTDTAAITAVRLIDTNGGNITSGSCSLYAYQS